MPSCSRPSARRPSDLGLVEREVGRTTSSSGRGGEDEGAGVHCEGSRVVGVGAEADEANDVGACALDTDRRDGNGDVIG